MTTTTHSGGQIRAQSEEYEDGVFLTLGDLGTVSIDKDVLVSIAAAHAAKWPQAQLGRSIFRSVDAHLIAQQAETAAALAELAKLRAALTHIQAWGTSSHNVAGTPLALYCEAALTGALP